MALSLTTVTDDELRALEAPSVISERELAGHKSQHASNNAPSLLHRGAEERCLSVCGRSKPRRTHSARATCSRALCLVWLLALGWLASQVHARLSHA